MNDLSKNRSKLVSNTLFLFVGNIISSVLTIFRQFFIAAVLEPSQFGIWNLLRVLLGYAHFSDLGISSGALYEKSKYHGLNNFDKAKEVGFNGFNSVLFLNILLSILVLILSFLKLPFLEDYTIILWLLSISLVTFSVSNFLNVEARVNHKFFNLGIFLIISSSVSLILSYICFKISSNYLMELFALSWIMGVAISTIFLIFSFPIKLSFNLDYKLIKQLFLIGFPISIVPILMLVFRTIDRWLLANIVSANELGFYTLGATIGLFLTTLPATIATTISPQLIENYSISNDSGSSKYLLLNSLFISGLLMAFIAGLLYLSLPFLINYFLQQYYSGIFIIQIVVMFNCIIFSLPITTNHLLSIGKKKILLAILAFAIAIILIIINIFSSYFSIIGLCYAIGVISIFFSLILVYISIHSLSYRFINIVYLILLFHLPSVACIFLANYIMEDFIFTNDILNDLFSSITHIAVYIFISILFLAGYFFISKSGSYMYNK